MNGNKPTEQQALQERQKFVTAFNDTMLKIWQEQITLLGVIDTGALLASPKALPLRADGRFFEVGLSQSFLEYGLWQDYGTGRETPRGNSGDLGRAKKRQRRRWFSRKYYASVMNLKEFLEENIGKEFCGIISSALSKDFQKRNRCDVRKILGFSSNSYTLNKLFKVLEASTYPPLLSMILILWIHLANIHCH